MAGASPDRLFNAEARAIDAMVWIDGVEVPYNSLSIQIAMDSPSVVQISIEPDELIDVWRPKSWVHIWLRDPFGENARAPHDGESPAEADQRDLDYDLDTYSLFWEGEVVGIRDTETSESRETIIEAHDLWNIPLNANINLVEIGAGIKTAYINGSTFFGDVFGDGAQTQSFVTLGIINYLFNDGDASYDRDANSPSKLKAGITQMGKQVLKYLSQFNASYGLQAWRTDFLGKFTGIPDAALENFLRLALIQDIVGVMQAVQPSDNVLGYMQQIITKFYHHFVTIPFPAPRQPGQDRRDRETGGFEQIWNEFAIIPNLYYAFPPLCNWLLPENYAGRDAGRSFMVEPTRLGMSSIMSTYAGFRTLHLAPEGLVEFLRQQSAASIANTGENATSLPRINASRDAELPVKEEAQIEFRQRGFYVDNTIQNPVNLLRYMTPAELEKGILYAESQNSYQELLGLASLNLDGEDVTDAQAVIQSKLDGNDPYLGFMRLLAQFELNFRQVSRSMSVNGIFNPWPVVGLPMLVCREGRSYKGLLTAISHQIAYSGQAATSYQLAYTQLFRPKALRERSGFQNAQQKLTDANDIRRAEFEATLNDLVSRNLLTAAEADRLREDNASLADLQSELNTVSDEVNAADDDFAPFEDEFRRRRSNASTFPGVAGYALSWWDNVEDYAGYALGLIDSQPGDDGITPTTFKTAFVDGTAAPSSLMDVLRDQFGKEIASPWPGQEEIGEDDPAVFWSSVAFPLRAVLEQLKKLVDLGVGNVDRTGTVYVTDSAREIEINNTNADIDQRIKELEQAKANVQQAASDAVAKSNDQVTEIAKLIAELSVSQSASSPNILAYQQRLRARADDLLAQIEQITTDQANAVAALDTEIEAELDKQDALPSVSLWDWADSLAQALRVFVTQIPEGTSEADALSRIEKSEFRPVFFDDNFRWENYIGPATWLTFAQLEAQQSSVVLSTIRRQLLAFVEAYIDYFEVDPTTLSMVTILQNMVRTMKDATDYYFESRADRFNREFGDSLDKINSNYSVFKEFLQENQLELPPLMPFSNASLINIANYDESVQNMVVPREDIGKYSFWADNVAPSFVQQGTTQGSRRFSSLRQEVVFRYDEFVRMARKIFPFNEEDSGTEYQAQAKQGTAASWANRLQARRGITMREFQDRYGLKVESRSASDPDTFGKGTYYIAVAESVGSEDTDLNSFFSKLGRINAVTGTSPARDPLFASINEMRGVVRNGSSPDWEFIKASVRQGIIEEYTRRHAVARAFRGKR